MIKQPLKEYLEKHVQYIPDNINDPCTYWNTPIDYNVKYELLKRDFKPNTSNFNLTARFLFYRYMNNSYWTWE